MARSLHVSPLEHTKDCSVRHLHRSSVGFGFNRPAASLTPQRPELLGSVSGPTPKVLDGEGKLS